MYCDFIQLINNFVLPPLTSPTPLHCSLLPPSSGNRHPTTVSVLIPILLAFLVRYRVSCIGRDPELTRQRISLPLPLECWDHSMLLCPFYVAPGMDQCFGNNRLSTNKATLPVFSLPFFPLSFLRIDQAALELEICLQLPTEW